MTHGATRQTAETAESYCCTKSAATEPSTQRPPTTHQHAMSRKRVRDTSFHVRAGAINSKEFIALQRLYDDVLAYVLLATWEDDEASWSEFSLDMAIMLHLLQDAPSRSPALLSPPASRPPDTHSTSADTSAWS